MGVVVVYIVVVVVYYYYYYYDVGCGDEVYYTDDDLSVAFSCLGYESSRCRCAETTARGQDGTLLYLLRQRRREGEF